MTWNGDRCMFLANMGFSLHYFSSKFLFSFMAFVKRLELQASQQNPSRPECESVWVHDLLAGRVTVRRGKVLAGCQLSPCRPDLLRLEDVLYLLERGTMALYEESGDSSRRRVSVKEVWSVLVDDTFELPADGQVKYNRALENYVVFAHLKRAGYRVSRPVSLETEEELNHFGRFEGPCWEVVPPVLEPASPPLYRVWTLSDLDSSVSAFFSSLPDMSEDVGDVFALVDGGQVCMLTRSEALSPSDSLMRNVK
jgi:hypothetical protein